jgi:uncharacterized protein (DUF2164 family)
MAITLDKTARAAALESIQRYFEQELEHPIGQLQAGGLLDFLIAEIGPSIYNQAVRATQGSLQQRVMEVDIEVHEEEFAYWRKRPRRG